MRFLSLVLVVASGFVVPAAVPTTTRRIVVRAERPQATAAQSKSNVGKLVFITLPFALGLVDIVYHDQLVALFTT